LLLKKRAVLLSYERNCVGKLGKELNLYSGALTKWRQEYKKKGIQSFQKKDHFHLTLKGQKDFRLEQKINKTNLKFEILKNAAKYLSKGKFITFDFILKNEKIYSIRIMSETLGVDRREYQRWKKEPINETQKRKNLIQKEIASIFFAYKRRYGSERIAIELQNSGYKIKSRTVRKYMRESGLSSLVKKN
jgi:transposase-like protein